MFLLSFVLEDWAIHELVPSPRIRRVALTLVASSYVTWTYQTHAFSNSVETLIVLWSVVMIQRILNNSVSPSSILRAKIDDNQHRSNVVSSALLGIFVTAGIFNRITFPAFLLAPGCFLLPHFVRRPWSLLAMILTIAITTFVAVSIDTSFYNPSAAVSIRALFRQPTLTPLNSLLYNYSTDNLSQHGLHPRYTHFLVNLPLLLGPAILLHFPHSPISCLPYLSALSGTTLLSRIPHQEPRFLLPVIPLLLSSTRPPPSKKRMQCLVAAWVIFNTLFGALMGVFHQGGVIPTQIWLGEQQNLELTEVLWWRTYSPPVWLLGGNNLNTTDLMGMRFEKLNDVLESTVKDCGNMGVGLVAPESSMELDVWKDSGGDERFTLEELWRYTNHLNLDDLDVGEEGALGTLTRVVGRRGLVLWRVVRKCEPGDEVFVEMG